LLKLKARYNLANLQFLETLITSILTFASTNIDDIFVLILFFATGRFKSPQIFAGQYLGILFLVFVGLIGSMVGNFVDLRYIGLFGLFPIYLGVKQFYELAREEEPLDQNEKLNSKGNGIMAVALVTIANGGDNIGVYIPLLATFSKTEKIVLFVVFSCMVFLWCFLARYLAKHPMLANSLSKYAHIIMPVVLILLGIFILAESKTYTLLN
jgi:cadmium resistance transport/sequestration family protein